MEYILFACLFILYLAYERYSDNRQKKERSTLEREEIVKRLNTIVCESRRINPNIKDSDIWAIKKKKGEFDYGDWGTMQLAGKVIKVLENSHPTNFCEFDKAEYLKSYYDKHPAEKRLIAQQVMFISYALFQRNIFEL